MTGGWVFGLRALCSVRKGRLGTLLLGAWLLGALLLGGVGCGPPLEQVVATAVARVPTPTPLPGEAIVATVVAGVPTPTPQPTPTPIPLADIVATVVARLPTPTPQPTPTPIPLESLIATVVARLPTPTPTPLPPAGAGLPSASAPTVGQILQGVAPSVAYIETFTGQGSGWAIGPDLIVTNAHVVGQARRVTVRWPSAPPVEGSVIATDPTRDLALIRVSATAPPLTPLRTRSLLDEDIGAPVLVVGYSLRSPQGDGTMGLPVVKAGILSGTLRRGGVSLLRVDAPMDPGDSGGPVLDRNGVVIGVNQVQVTETRGGQRVVGVFYAIAMGEVEGFLRDWGIRP
ncbi:MAG: serine protease [Dehalococcoidia bacterium]|nr:serine protease [Dehalococcoidia bacterium]MDW8119603.1 serine protease [Chloroflexota bacterium]